MPNYNNGLKYNTGADTDGLNYNGRYYVKELKVTDSIGLGDSNVGMTARSLVIEPVLMAEMIKTKISQAMTDSLGIKDFDPKATILFKAIDSFLLNDNGNDIDLLTEVEAEETMPLLELITASIIYSVTDSMSISDNPPVLNVVYHSTDSFGISDRIKDLVAGIENSDNLNFEEKIVSKVWLEALDEAGFDEDIKQWANSIKAVDNISLADLGELFSHYYVYDSEAIIDKDAKKSISDFYITKDKDGLYDIIMPFGLIIDWGKTSIPFMPEATDTTAKIAGADGEIVQDTVYEPRLFDISAVTLDGLTIEEKADIKKRIAQILHRIKKKTATITFGERDTTFDVKYTGLAETTDHAGWVQFDMPLKSPSAWGRKQFIEHLQGSGLLVNDGDDPCGFTMTLTGYWANPTFTVGDTRFSFNLTLQAGEKLVIDTVKMICHYNGQNAVPYMTSGDLTKKIPVGSLALTAPEQYKNQIYTEWQELVLY